MRLVLAYGNPSRGDDGVAWRVAEALGGEADVEVRCTHQLLPELAVHVGEADGVLFVDAAVGEAPGQVAVCDVTPHPEESAFGHILRPAGLLDLTRRLGGEAPPAMLLTVTVQDVGFGLGLSAEVERSLEAATRAARSALDRLRGRNPCGRVLAKH